MAENWGKKGVCVCVKNLTAANRRWADWIAARMATRGKVLVAIGAGHLAGKDSIPALLVAKGLKVERVQ